MYTSTITETTINISSKVKEIAIKDTSDAVKLDDATQDAGPDGIKIQPSGYAVLKIENDRSEDGEYLNYLIFDREGKKYVTGSSAFWNSFRPIFDELKDEAEPWTLRIFRKPSAKRPGKDFITCAVVIE